MQRRGFSLLEILIALAVMGILLVGFIQFFSSTLQSAKDLDSRSDLVTEGQIAHQLLTSRLQEAWYVYPPGTAINLSHSDSWRITKPSGGTNWTVEHSTEPFVAVILPPLVLEQTCSAATTGGCYRFYAYYPILRSTYVAQTGSRYTDRLIADPVNPNAWVLMQYSGYIPNGFINSGSTAPLTINFSNLLETRADLLADYFLPINTSVTFSNYQPFDLMGSAPYRMAVDLRFSRSAQGRTILLGGTSDSLKSEVLARNQGIAAP